MKFQKTAGRFLIARRRDVVRGWCVRGGGMDMGIWTIGTCAMRRKVWSYDVMHRATEGCVRGVLGGKTRHVEGV